MKIYDLRAFNILEITEIIKGYRDCKIILTLQQYQNLPRHTLQLCYYRGISIDITHSGYAIYSSDNSVPKLSLGSFWVNEGYKQLPDNVFFNDKKKATTLMFDDTATVVKCGKDDKYSRRVGFLEAYFQATCGLSKTQAKKYLDKIVEDKEVKKK